MYLTAESSAVFILCRISQIIRVKFTASLYIQYTENLQHLSAYSIRYGTADNSRVLICYEVSQITIDKKSLHNHNIEKDFLYI